jgi:cytochrome c556
MPDTSQGISIGDAVISFIGDTQQLDQSLDSIGPKVEAGVSRASGSLNNLQSSLNATGESADEAGEEVQEAMTRSTGSVREARGEVALFGEEFGVRLPRHVQTFVAQLPGVGEALESAFAATAVVFIAEAVVKLTEKVSDFIATTFIYTDAMKAADAAAKGMNDETQKQIATLKAATDEVNRYGKSRHDLAELDINNALAKNLAEIAKNADAQIEVLKDAAAKSDPLWKRVLGYATLGLAGTTSDTLKENAKNLADGILQIQKEAANQALVAKKTADEQQLLEDKKTATEIAAFWKTNNKQISDDARQAADAVIASNHTIAESMKENDKVIALPRALGLADEGHEDRTPGNRD